MDFVKGMLVQVLRLAYNELDAKFKFPDASDMFVKDVLIPALVDKSIPMATELAKSGLEKFKAINLGDEEQK